MDPSKTRPIQLLTPGPGRHLHGRNPNQRFRQHGMYCSKISSLLFGFYCPFVTINPSLESVNLWNTFPDPTFNVPIPAQDGTYTAEIQTNDLDYMEYFDPRFHCRIPNVYHPFFTINLKLEKKSTSPSLTPHSPFHLQHPSFPPTRTAPLLHFTPTTLLPHHTLFRIDLQALCNG
ncbi:unnamed protein product [Bursaphelenchus xylophilus]|uniref:(pine wood nematode) hypothetical protein n=1 Tax=Bursaphelenchus xylophilus TaxID=6326 RepID=A0A7I8XP75_BURXY|nr:unnamed protein product [Bursaphelenchus xylophilus]CAG9086799.1 unnamed protein product [Bursaphelenchus xylophilus]